jgi:hypothetical protein
MAFEGAAPRAAKDYAAALRVSASGRSLPRHGFDVADQLAELVRRHVAHGLAKLPNPALPFVRTEPWLFRHARTATSVAGPKFPDRATWFVFFGRDLLVWKGIADVSDGPTDRNLV